MKTAISIPDAIFEAAEQLAAKQSISRSELYAKAVAEYVSARSDQAVTEKINDVLASESVELDPVLNRMQLDALRNCPW